MQPSALQIGHISIGALERPFQLGLRRAVGQGQLEADARDAVAARLMRHQVEYGVGLDLADSEARFLEGRGHSHREAASQRREQELLGIGLAVAVEPAVVGEGRRKRSAPHAERPDPVARRPRPADGSVSIHAACAPGKPSAWPARRPAEIHLQLRLAAA